MPFGLLELLRRNRGQWLTMEALARALGRTPGQILEQMEKIRALGHTVEAVPARGYRLAGMTDSLSADPIEYGLNTSLVGKKILLFDETDSTNTVAWHYAKEKGYDGLAVFAEVQRQGRGRLGRTWEAGKGQSLLCSILFQNLEGVTGASLSLAAGLATARAIEAVCGIPARIKWPNDVMLEGRKAAGTMLECRKVQGATVCVMGIGINVNQTREDFPEEIRDRAISLRQACGERADRNELAQGLLRETDYWFGVLKAGRSGELHDEWLARCDTIGRRISLRQDGRAYAGRVVDVLVDEGLLVQLDSGGIRIFDSSTSSVVA